MQPYRVKANPKAQVMARPLRQDELEKHGEDIAWIVMSNGEVELLTDGEMKAKYYRPDARGIHND